MEVDALFNATVGLRQSSLEKTTNGECMYDDFQDEIRDNLLKNIAIGVK